MAEIIAVCRSEKKGTRKKDIGSGNLIAHFGMENDAHAAFGQHRQISLLAWESIEKMRQKGADVGCGDFGENIVTEGLELFTLPVGTRLLIGESVLGEVSQIGKNCHSHCEIYKQIGDCIMPREGIFVRILKGGEVKKGDSIRIADEKITVGILTISDKGSRGEREDLSGPAIAEIMNRANGMVVESGLVPDEKEQIAATLVKWVYEKSPDIIFTTGGTGLSARDVTPEATKEVIEKEIPGFAEVMRGESLKKTPHAMLSRAVAGIRCNTIIINLPGSPKAVRENLEAILPALPHGVAILRGAASECGNQKSV